MKEGKKLNWLADVLVDVRTFCAKDGLELTKDQIGVALLALELDQANMDASLEITETIPKR